MRIIAGTNKGQTILAPEGTEVRPTLDRVKEAMFGRIQFDVPGAMVLDLFAGSGNLGLEALSRGAKYAVFNDVSPRNAAVIRANIKKLGFEGRCSVYVQDYLSAIRTAAGSALKFDIVFLDPPYKAGILESAIEALCDFGVLRENAILVAEHANGSPPKVTRGELVLTPPRKYGDVAVSIIRREPVE